MLAQWERGTTGCQPPSPALPAAPRAQLSTAVCREQGQQWWPDPGGGEDLAAAAILPIILTLWQQHVFFAFPGAGSTFESPVCYLPQPSAASPQLQSHTYSMQVFTSVSCRQANTE